MKLKLGQMLQIKSYFKTKKDGVVIIEHPVSYQHTSEMLLVQYSSF